MGFYGNISSVNKSTFQFDKIYPNRKEMDDACEGDGIFIGRYVLVDYNEDSILGYVHAQIANEDLKDKPVVVGYQERRREIVNGTVTNDWEVISNRFYSGIPEEVNTPNGPSISEDRLYTIGESNSGSMVMPGTLLLSLGYMDITTYITRGSNEESDSYYHVIKIDNELDVADWDENEIYSLGDKVKYNGKIYRSIVNENANNPLTDNSGWELSDLTMSPQIFIAGEDAEEGFVYLQDIDDIWDYNKGRFFINHQIDATFYGNIGRGWDSTVWQKTYKNGQAAYVMIAELNSVVPTFDVVSDAPTPIPQKPYYDADSSNVYYRLHVQPSWGLRVKAANDRDYSNGFVYPSDKEDNYYVGSNVPIKKDLAIYWFDKGFHKYIETESEWQTGDDIRITPTGKSGNTYYDKYEVFGKTGIDTYELSMMLPSIGETVSKLWNLVYGKGTYKDTLGNRLWNKAASGFNEGEGSDFKVANEEKGIKIRNTNLEWNTRNGLRAYWQYKAEESPELIYNKTALNTLAGTINTVHDLMGMIIIEEDNLFEENDNQRVINPANVDPSNIYYDKTTKKYYRKGKKYIFTDQNLTDGLVAYSGTNMFNPGDGNHYRLESYPFDSYDDIYEEQKESETPVYEQIIDNFYKVGANDSVYEDEVYGTLSNITSLTEDNFTLENFDPTQEDEAEFLWWLHEDSGEYIHEVKTNPTHGQYFKITAVQQEIKPEFYIPKTYYLMWKRFDESENIEENIAACNAWNASSPRKQGLDFDYLGIITEKSLFEDYRNENGTIERSAIHKMQDLPENFNKILGYKILKNVYIDPARSSFILVDKNRIKNEYFEGEVEDNENLEYDASEEVTPGMDRTILYVWNGYSAPLQGLRMVEIPNSDPNEPSAIRYYYDITAFEKPGDSTLRSLKEWKEYITNNEFDPEDYKDLVPKIKLEKQVTEPYYSLDRAEDIQHEINDIPETNYTGYYFLYEEDPLNIDTYREGQRFYKPISAGEVNSDQAKTWPWYALDPIAVPVYYNLNGKYYIKDEDDNYLRETSSMLFLEDLPPASDENEEDDNSSNENNATPRLQYYTVTFTPETKTAFIPDTFYYKDGNNYKLAKTFNPSTDSSKTYYRYIDQYVDNDPNGIYEKGARWNKEVNAQTAGVTVKAKRFEWEFQEIPDFAKDMNTIHGLILKINQMLLAGDKITRDNSTVQGCINLINDILDKFDQLKPAEIVMVDKLGRIHSGDWDSKQKSSTQQGTAPAIPTGEPAVADDERWIKLSTTAGISPDFKPHIKLEHMFRAGTDTTSTSNLNTDNVASNNDSDKMQLYTPILDNMGHVVAKNIETVTLPYGFKTISTNGRESNNNTTILAAQDNIVAENTQDILGINSGNEWVKIETNPNTDVITISHDVKNTTSSVSTLNLSTETSGPMTFDIPTYLFDNTNHYASHDVKTLTMPNSYGKFTGDTGSSEATATHDTFSVIGDTWVTTNVGTDSISLAHSLAHDAVTISMPAATPANAVEPQFGDTFILPDWTFDKNGHQKGISTHTVKIPQGSLTDASANGADVITQLAFTASSGALSTTRTNVGTLLLTGYESQETNPIIRPTNSINTAFAAVENSLFSLIGTNVDDKNVNSIFGAKAYADDIGTAANTYTDNAINNLEAIYDTGEPDPENPEQNIIDSASLNELLERIHILEAKVYALENPESNGGGE